VPGGDEADPSWLVTSEDPEADMAELCYIPTLGGGFGFTWSEVERWPLSRKRRMLDWLRNRREREAKALAGKGGTGVRAGADDFQRMSPPRGADDFQRMSPPRGPSLSRPGPP